MKEFFAQLDKLFLAFAFGSLVFGVLARLLGVRGGGWFFLLGALFLLLALRARLG